MAADPVTLAFTALNVGSSLFRTVGEYQATSFRSEQAKAAARAGRVAADQTDAQLREELRRTIGAISAVRASAGIDPRSPTTDAVIEEEKRIGDRERRIRVGNLRNQAAMDAASARFFRRSARNTLLFGTIGSLARAGSLFPSGRADPWEGLRESDIRA